MVSDLKNLKEKECKLELNATTLSDYWRKGLIPRGLHIKKFPPYGGQDRTDFKNKWEAILNKCSFDLMLLLIEESKKYVQDVQVQTDEVTQSIKSCSEEAKKKERLQLQARSIYSSCRIVKLLTLKRTLGKFPSELLVVKMRSTLTARRPRPVLFLAPRKEIRREWSRRERRERKKVWTIHSQEAGTGTD